MIKKNNRIITIILTFVLLCSIFVVSAFAWQAPPNTASNMVLISAPNDMSNYVAMAYYDYGATTWQDLKFVFDFDYVSNPEYILEGIPTFNSCNQLSGDLYISDNDIYSKVQVQMSEYLSINIFTQNIYDEGFQNGLVSNSAYDEGYSQGKIDGFRAGESYGYTQGVNEAEVGENFLLTLFSVPSYVISTIFNFELFGINIYLLITFLLTIAIVGVVLKKIL